MPTPPLTALFCVAGLFAAAQPSETTTTESVSPTSTTPWEAPPIDRAVTVFNGHTGAILTFDQMLDALSEADAVFLGETHIDETTHRVELAVYEGLLQRRDDAVVLAMEMFERDTQPILDAYLAREIEEDEFLEQARPWKQYRSAYRSMIERARSSGLPVIASNFPRALTRRVAMEGLSVLDDLDSEQRAHAPAEIHPNTPEYWRRVDNAVRGHLSMMRQSDSDDQRLTSTQTLWDNSMGESCALALDAHPGSMVLHVNGGFHSMYWDGTVRQFQLRKPDASVLTVAINPARNPSVVRLGGAPIADFVVMAESRAMDLNEGRWSVALDQELKYRFLIPDHASDTNRVPLLIWLGDDGLTSQDGVELWQDRLGKDVAIAVLDPPYRAVLGDLSEGGRWFWSDSFAGDIGSTIGATERLWAYLLRNYPIDPDLVCVAGEGTGATVTAAIALLGDRMDHHAVAFEPRRYSRLKDFPLPLPEYQGDSDREVTLTVSGSTDDQSWWSNELNAYREVGLPSSFRASESLNAHRDARQEATLRAALGLPANAMSQEAPSARMLIPGQTPRARHWARLYAMRHTTHTGQPITLIDGGTGPEANDAPVITTPQIHPSTVGELIPRCPGPFGGTTLLLLPKDTPAEDIQQWLALETNDPLNKASRFHRLRIAMASTDDEERTLKGMLTALESQNRKNVLIVPAEFSASPNSMQSLERQAREFSDRMTIEWLPGLGGVVRP